MDLNGCRVLITGASGLLGSKLVEALSGRCQVYAVFNRNLIERDNCEAHKLDLTNGKSVYKLIEDASPDVVIHSAALTNLDYCEKNHKEAWDVNVNGTSSITDACRTLGSKLVYISTDYVFDGCRGRYKEDDVIHPINYYAETKYAGEKIVQGLKDHIIARTSVLYGWHPRPNYVVWVIKELQAGRIVNIACDQYNSPTFADNLSEILVRLIESDERGIFHTAGNERISRLDFARNIADIFSLNGKLINPITSADLKWVAKRPMDSSLDVSKVSCFIKPMNTKEGLEKMRDTI